MTKRIKTTWDIATYDVWGNRKDGYEVNDVYRQSRDLELMLKVTVNNVGLPSEFESAYPSDYAIRQIFGVTCQIETEGDDLDIYVNRRSDGYPIGEMICTSHESLSPIRTVSADKIAG
jgi:hypothetical protein